MVSFFFIGKLLSSAGSSVPAFRYYNTDLKRSQYLFFLGGVAEGILIFSNVAEAQPYRESEMLRRKLNPYK